MIGLTAKIPVTIKIESYLKCDKSCQFIYDAGLGDRVIKCTLCNCLIPDYERTNKCISDFTHNYYRRAHYPDYNNTCEQCIVFKCCLDAGNLTPGGSCENVGNDCESFRKREDSDE